MGELDTPNPVDWLTGGTRHAETAVPMRQETAQVPRVVLLRADAPPKPPTGAPCNGCGVCCAAEPCPLGVLVSGRRQGRCRALRWQPGPARYACGVLLEPARWLPPLRLLPTEWGRRLTRRWIAAGAGCDAPLAAERTAA